MRLSKLFMLSLPNCKLTTKQQYLKILINLSHLNNTTHPHNHQTTRLLPLSPPQHQLKLIIHSLTHPVAAVLVEDDEEDCHGDDDADDDDDVEQGAAEALAGGLARVFLVGRIPVRKGEKDKVCE